MLRTSLLERYGGARGSLNLQVLNPSPSVESPKLWVRDEVRMCEVAPPFSQQVRIMQVSWKPVLNFGSRFGVEVCGQGCSGRGGDMYGAVSINQEEHDDGTHMTAAPKVVHKKSAPLAISMSNTCVVCFDLYLSLVLGSRLWSFIGARGRFPRVSNESFSCFEHIDEVHCDPRLLEKALVLDTFLIGWPMVWCSGDPALSLVAFPHGMHL